jgi:hypothetical protein
MHGVILSAFYSDTDTKLTLRSNDAARDYYNKTIKQ